MFVRSEKSDERPKKFATIIAERIVHQIVANKLQPGDMLQPEHIMLQEYRVGRATLREALRYLELQGVLTIRPGPRGGPMVKEIDSTHLASTLSLLLSLAGTEFSEFVAARRMLEPMVAGYAAKHATKDDLAELRASCERLGEAVGDQEAFNEENRFFHEQIAWLSGNHVFGFMMSALHRLTIDNTARRFDQKAQRAVVSAHFRVCDELDSRDPQRASAAMADHLQEWVDRLNKRTPDLLKQPIDWRDTQ